MTTKQKIRFTGGDDFIGLLRLYHETMMLNELTKGKGGYEVSWAKNKNSGVSFGGNQMDISKNPDKADVFVTILEEARDNNGLPFFTKDELITMVGEENEKIRVRGKSVEIIFKNKLDTVNAALSSEYGQSRINEEYGKEMNKKAQFIETVINSIQNPAAKAFYDTVPGRMFLFDYNNQFNINLKGPFVADYIDGLFNNKQKTIFSTKEKTTAPIDNYTIKDHKAFLDSTEECHERSRGCDRRLSNIGKVFTEHHDLIFSVAKELASTIPQPAEKIFPDDFSFFRKNGKWEISLDLKLPPFIIPDPEVLTPREMLRQASAGELYEYLPSGTFIQRDTFYYDGTSKHLFYIFPEVGRGAAAPFPHSEGEWYTIKQILIRKYLESDKEQYAGEMLPRYPNLANYDSYSLSMKKSAIEKEDLLSSLEKEVSEPDTLALLSTFLHSNIPDLTEKTKKVSLDESMEEFFTFLNTLSEKLEPQGMTALSEQDVFSGFISASEATAVNTPVLDYQPSIWEGLYSYFPVSTPPAEG